MAELAAQPFVMREAGASICRWVDGHSERLGVRPRVVLELGHTEAVKRAVQANFGAAYPSRDAIEQERAAGWLRIVEVDSPRQHRPVYAMHSSASGLGSAASQFLEVARLSRHTAADSAGADPTRRGSRRPSPRLRGGRVRAGSSGGSAAT